MKQQQKRRMYLLCAIVAAAIVGVFFIHENFPHSNSQGTVSSAGSSATSIPVTGTASLSLIGPTGSTEANGTVPVGESQHVTWTSVNYAAPTVSVNIIRKTSDNPARYELVRTVAQAMRNSGDALWIPTPSDAGTDTFVQIGCTLSAQACQASSVTGAAPLAILDTGLYDNTASAYDASFEATEALYNK